MPLFQNIPIDDGQIGIWQFAETSDELMNQIQLTDSERTELGKYSFEKRKIEWLSVRLMLKQIIGPNFSIDYTLAGKPLLKHDRYRFLSVTHARNYAAVIVHERFEVGIDLEHSGRNYNYISKRYLSDQEMERTNGNALMQCLYWCAKEAVFKVVPDEGVDFRADILISPFNPEKDQNFPARYTRSGFINEYTLYFRIFDQYGLVWVVGS